MFKDGRVYTGEFKLNKANGRGTLKYSDGTRYNGEF